MVVVNVEATVTVADVVVTVTVDIAVGDVVAVVVIDVVVAEDDPLAEGRKNIKARIQ